MTTATSKHSNKFLNPVRDGAVPPILHLNCDQEEGTTSISFDITVMGDLDLLHLFGDVVDRLPQLQSQAAFPQQFVRDKRLEDKHCIAESSENLLQIHNWKMGNQQ